ncbi:MAG: CpsD/CapB family tyrosine-protein kinase [Steroidobacterales bacterium]
MMERIRQAMDRARGERGHVDSADLHELGTRSQPAPVVTYTRTRVFEANAELLERNRILPPQDRSAAGHAIRMLRTQLLQRMQEHGFRTLAVLSPADGDGKTTTAINLAISMAADRRHTALLVDLDLHRPGIAGRFGLVPEAGVDDVFAGEAPIERALYHPEGLERLVLLPARAPMAGSSETLAGPRARDLVRELKSRYPDRVIIFDLPPVLAADDAVAFSPLIDCAILVVAEARTQREDVGPCLTLLRQTPVLGTVLNCATDVRAPY